MLVIKIRKHLLYVLIDEIELLLGKNVLKPISKQLDIFHVYSMFSTTYSIFFVFLSELVMLGFYTVVGDYKGGGL